MIEIKILAFASLVFIQTFGIFLIRVAQSKGNYDFNPSSSIAMSEMVKMAMSLGLHFSDKEQVNFMQGFKEATNKMWFTLIGLAFLYAVNNQLTFFILTMTDPGTLTLGKSSTPMLTAALNLIFFSIPLNRLQWSCIVLQICGLVVVLLDSCNHESRVSANGLVLLVIACTITAVTSVVNARLLKTEKISLHVQNSILYSFGVVFNLVFFYLGLSASKQTNFFGGYDSIWAILILVCNSFMGLAINFVYKYGDAIIKTFASAASSAILLYISTYFNVPINIVQVVGSVVVFVACYIYFSICPDIDKYDAGLSAANGEATSDGSRTYWIRIVLAGVMILGVFSISSFFLSSSSSPL